MGDAQKLSSLIKVLGELIGHCTAGWTSYFLEADLNEAALRQTLSRAGCQRCVKG